jgi:Ca-activated chloride channel homolog
MLELAVKPHRKYLRANIDHQKLFVMLKMFPSPEVAQARPQIELAVVIDTSGSMGEPAPGKPLEIIPCAPFVRDGVTYSATYRGTSKLDVALEAIRQLLDSVHLRAANQISLIQFDDTSQVIASGTVAQNRTQLLSGIEHLKRMGGGTQMAKGLHNAADELARTENTARKVLLLTDGRTTDEDDCRRAATRLFQSQAPIVALGIGETYNEDLLRDLCNTTLGRPFDLRDMTMLPAIFEQELSCLARQVISNVRLTLKPVRGVQLVSATRVYPTLASVDVNHMPLELGSIESEDFTIFILELNVPAYAGSQARLAQLGLSFFVPAWRHSSEEPLHDLIVTFTDDEAATMVVDAEVAGYVQQRNVDNLVRQATELASADPERALKTLELARLTTQRFGNAAMTIALDHAQDELRRTGTITPATSKTIKLGARTQTVRLGNADSPASIPTQQEIRQITGA